MHALKKELERLLNYEVDHFFTSDVEGEERLLIKSIKQLRQHQQNKTDKDVSYQFKIILDRLNELINIGHWKDVSLILRQIITLACYLQVIEYVQSCIRKDNPICVETACKFLDHGLLFGSPLTLKPNLLQEAATTITMYNKVLIEPLLVNIEKHVYENSDESIPVIECPSMEFFLTDIIKKQRPVVLKNCINHWPAIKLWKDMSYLLKKAGHRTVPVEIGSKYTDQRWSQKLMTLQEFIQKFIIDESDTVGYLAQHQLFNQIPELLNDIYEPDYCTLAESDDGVDMNAWFGPKNTVSPLHFDPKNNLLAQVVGSKHVILFDPKDSLYLYPHEENMLSNTAQVNAKNPEYDKFPEFSKAQPFKCFLNPGDMLYIPSKWWHYVESMSVSFSVSFWWR